MVSRETEGRIPTILAARFDDQPSLSALQTPSRVLHRSQGVMVAGPGVLSWGSASPSLTCPRLQHRGATRRVEVVADPLPSSVHSTSVGTRWSGRMRASQKPRQRPNQRFGCHDLRNSQTSGEGTPLPPRPVDLSSLSAYFSNDGPLGVHMFHVKPSLPVHAPAPPATPFSEPRIMGYPTSAAMFHVKRSVDAHRVRAEYPSRSETTVGPRH